MQSTDATADVRNPSECDRCRATLERGWSERWSGDSQETMVRVEVVCFNCDRAEYRAEYKQTGVLTSKMTIDAAIYGVLIVSAAKALKGGAGFAIDDKVGMF